MTVAFRILSLLLCLLMAGPMSLPAHSVARPENRVWEIFSDPLKSAPADLDQTAGLRWENPCCGYDFASGMHKYLYCHADPVNNTDPSGMAVREIPSNFELGNLVEDAVAVDFKAKRPASFADRSIHRILERIPGYKGVGRLRPDFADPIAYEIYDVKSWGETAEGFAKVELYVALLRSSDINPDPNRSAWHAGNTYQMTVPVFPVPGKPKIYAQVYPSFAGVIPYKLYQVDNDLDWRYIPIPVTVPEELRRLVWNGRTEREWRFAPQYAYNAAKYTAAVGVAAITGYALGQAAVRAQMIPILRF